MLNGGGKAERCYAVGFTVTMRLAKDDRADRSFDRCRVRASAYRLPCVLRNSVTCEREVGTTSCSIIVLGPERSGTSVVAQMVYRWGAYAGEPERLRSPDPHNPLGYWEYTPIWDFLVQLGDLDSGTSWWRPSFQELVAHRLTVSEYADRAGKMIAAMETGRPWVWKDPALCFFLPFWNGIWRLPIFVIAVRNPYDTAVSWRRFVMAGIAESPLDPVPVNLLRWQYMMLLILSNTPRQTPAIFVPYEQLMRRPTTCAKRLAEFLDRAVDAGSPSRDRIRSMADAVHPELWRQRIHPRLRHVPGATVEQEALYGFVRRRVTQPNSPFIAARYPMPPGWEDVVEEQEAKLRQQRTEDGTARQEP